MVHKIWLFFHLINLQRMNQAFHPDKCSLSSESDCQIIMANLDGRVSQLHSLPTSCRISSLEVGPSPSWRWPAMIRTGGNSLLHLLSGYQLQISCPKIEESSSHPSFHTEKLTLQTHISHFYKGNSSSRARLCGEWDMLVPWEGKDVTKSETSIAPCAALSEARLLRRKVYVCPFGSSLGHKGLHHHFTSHKHPYFFQNKYSYK